MAKKDTMTAKELIELVSGNVKNKPLIVGENKELFNAQYYIDTGFPLLNTMISGDPYKGVPGDLSIQLTGPPGSGKSLVAKFLARNFNKMFPNGVIDVHETEGAISADDWSKFVNLDNMTFTKVKHVIDLKDSIVEKLKPIKRGYNWMMITDSVGNLPDSEQYAKNLKGDDTPTMGKKAKESNVLFSAILDTAHEKHVCMVFINRKYDAMNTNMFTPKDEKEITAGGKANSYAPSISLDFKKKIIEDKIEYLNANGDLKEKRVPVGIEIKVTSDKNRIGKEHSIVTLYIDMNKGVMPYYGLQEYAFKAGLLKKDKDGRSNVWYIAGTEEPFKTVPDITDEAWERCLQNGLADFLRSEFKQVDLFQKLGVENESKGN